MIVHNIPLDGETETGAAEAKAAPDLRQIPTAQNQKEPAPAKKEVSAEEHALKVKDPQQSILENTDKMAQFTDLMTQIVGTAIAANNRELSRCISEDVGEQVIKEMNYLMREQEEAQEERFSKLDAAIRGNLKKKESKRWGKKKAQ